MFSHSQNPVFPPRCGSRDILKTLFYCYRENLKLCIDLNRIKSDDLASEMSKMRQSKDRKESESMVCTREKVYFISLA